MYRSSTTLIVLFVVFVCLSATLTWCDTTAEPASGKEQPEVEIINTFKPEDCKRKAKVTDVIKLHYKGTLQDGTIFDSSYERDDPFSFQLGIGQVIRGWDKGLLNLCVGEKRKLIIPPELGYGAAAQNKIPAHSTLIFEVECLGIEDGPNPLNVFKEIDKNGDSQLSREEVQEFLKIQLAHSGGQGGGDMSDHASMLDEIFEHEDKDKDGFITKDEFSGPKHDHDEL